MTAQPLQTLNSVYSFHHSISLLSSIEDIFSRDIGNGTRTMQDLVKLLQPLKLALYRGTDMHDITQIGEGGSYRVFRCVHQKKQLVAAKIIKLPQEPSVKEKENFRRRIFCLIKDVEIMHHPPLAEHENILGILGYGWNLSEDSALPFLVTEYAEQGTLRDFLRKKTTTTVAEKLKLCGNIASGLHAIHLCGVSHGDLKLENVLVFREAYKPRSMVEQFSAKLSDFGNSCMNSSEQAYGSTQSYRGTVGYIPPELYQAKPTAIDFPKCDIWALALVVWETLVGGLRYTEDCKVKFLLHQETSRLSQPRDSRSNENDTGGDSASKPGYELFLISENLCQLAIDSTEIKLRRKISPISQALVKQIFRMALQKDPIKRCGDVSKLPFTYSKHSTTGLSYSDTQPHHQHATFIEQTEVQSRWSFDVFTPHQLRALKLPHTVKAQMVADAKLAAMAASDVVDSKASSALYVGIAYCVGFGVEQNMEESLSWISRSATQGSPAASLILKIMNHPETRQETILNAFKHSFEGLANSSVQGTCRFVHQNSEALDLSSFSSADYCNPLHYLSLFEGFTDPQSHLRSSGLDIVKRKDIKTVNMGSQSHLKSDERSVVREKDLKPRKTPLEQGLCEIVRHLGSKFIQKTTKKNHYLHAQFPMTLSGTPLSFAILLDCREAIKALANEVRDSRIEPSELEAAVSCHRSETFSLLWSNYLSRGDIGDIFDLLIYSEKGSQLISALANRSSMERTMLHGSNCPSAQIDIIVALIVSLSELATQRYSDKNLRQAANLAFVKMVGKGLEQIIELGDLDIAIEVGQTISSQAITPFIDELHDKGVFKAALDMACSGCFDLGRSKKFLDFARSCRNNLDSDFQALKTTIEHSSGKLFQRCMEDGIDVSGCDEDGQNLLYYMITTGFYTFVPVRQVISYGADPNHSTREGQTPLHLAAMSGLPLVVKELLDRGAESSAVDKSGTSVLLHAIGSRNISVVVLILEALEAKLEELQSESSFAQASQIRDHSPSYGADRSLTEFGTVDRSYTEEGPTALQLAARNHDAEMITLLLRHGARPDAMDSNDNVALHHIGYGATEDADNAIICYHLLLEAEKSELPRNKEGDTPLHPAAQRYTGDSLPKLLTCFVRQHGCDVDIQNARGETVLHQAANQMSVNSVSTILKYGAAINRQNAQGRTALHHFIRAAYGFSGNSSTREHKLGGILKTLIDGGADPLMRDKSQDSDGYTAMEYAAINGNIVLFFALFAIARQNPQSPTAPEQWLSSAWSLSVAEEQWQLLKQLLARDSDFDPDLSLLMWPAGAHLLKYAIAVYDTELLTKFSTKPLETPETSSRRVERKDHEKAPNIYSEDTAKLSLTSWQRLPSALRSVDRFWSSDQVRNWEASVESYGIHRGGDPLNEIFDFMVTLDRSILKVYYGNTDQQRFPVNENAFRWEDYVNDLTTTSHAALVLHGEKDNMWMYPSEPHTPEDEGEETEEPDNQSESESETIDQEHDFLNGTSSGEEDETTSQQASN